MPQWSTRWGRKQAPLQSVALEPLKARVQKMLKNKNNGHNRLFHSAGCCCFTQTRMTGLGLKHPMILAPTGFQTFLVYCIVLIDSSVVTDCMCVFMFPLGDWWSMMLDYLILSSHHIQAMCLPLKWEMQHIFSCNTISRHTHILFLGARLRYEVNWGKENPNVLEHTV